MFYLKEASLLGLIILFGFIPKIYVRTWINPVSMFVFVWGFNLMIFNAVSDIYIEITTETWWILIASFSTYCLGAFSSWSIIPDQRWLWRNLSSEDRISILRSAINRERMKLAIYFLIFAGGLFFIYYIISLASLQGIKQMFFTLLDTRAVMREEGVLPGFHFLYFWEMLLPITVIYVLLFGQRKDSILVTIILILTFCLILTGAKTNIAKALIWSFVFYSLLKYESVKLNRIIFIVGCGVFIGVFLFFIHTSFTGELGSLSAQTAEVIARFSAPFPTFHALINDSSLSHSDGKLMLLPLVKLAHIVQPEIYVPSPILEFYNVPILFNLATYLDIFYRDFGIVGVVILPWFFGMFSAGVFYLYSVRKNNFFVIFAMSIILLWTIGSPNTAGFVKPSFWFQIILGYMMYRFIRVKNHSVHAPYTCINKTGS